jgi:hypothetical protein
MSDPNMVTITLEEYERLMDVDELLSALDAAGVDNWEGYDDAMEIYREGLE